MIADEPDLYFTTSHFDGYPAVLVKLAEIDELGLRELIVEAWLTQAKRGAGVSARSTESRHAERVCLSKYQMSL